MIKEDKDVFAPKQEVLNPETKGAVISDNTLITVNYKNHVYYYDPVLNIITNKDSKVMM